MQPLTYGAREMDPETGLVFMRARYYDPTLGRFVSEDPIALAGGINPYAYVSGDPLGGRDSNGLCPEYQFYHVDGGGGLGECRTLSGYSKALFSWSYLQSGFSRRFGARGNAATSGGQRAAILGGVVAEEGDNDRARHISPCTVAKLALLATAVGDGLFVAAIVSGAGTAVGFGKLAVPVGRTLVANAGSRFGMVTFRQAAGQTAEAMAINLDVAARKVGIEAADWGKGAYISANVSMAPGLEAGWRDWVPGFATSAALRTMNEACTSR